MTVTAARYSHRVQSFAGRSPSIPTEPTTDLGGSLG
jgi:hypothetical protein